MTQQEQEVRTLHVARAQKTVEAKVLLSYVWINDMLYAYRHQIAFDREDATGMSALVSINDVDTYGIATLPDLVAYEKGACNEIKRISRLCYVTQEFLDDVRTRTPFYATQAHKLEAFDASAYGAAVRGELDPDRLVTVNLAKMMVYDRFGRPVASAIQFDFMNGSMSDINYDLGIALRVLSADKRVVPVNEKREKIQALEITAIPYYLESDASQELRFCFTLSSSEQLVLQEAAGVKEVSGWAQIRQAMFDTDIMGLRAAGAQKTERIDG